MKKTFENKYNMAKVVQAYLEEQDAATINASPGLDQDVDLLKQINNEINRINEFQMMDRTGYRIYKNISKEAVINSVINCAFGLMAFAKPIPNQIMYNQVKTTRSELLGLRDNELRSRALFLYHRAMENQPDLDVYGVTVAFLSNLLTEIEVFNEQISQPRLNLTERTELTELMVVEFEKLNNLLSDMDTKVNALSILFPLIVKRYKNCRIIVNYRGSVLAISGEIKDLIGNSIFGAICTLTELGKTVKSTAKGNFEFKNVPNGQYNLQVKRPGFEIINQSISVVKGETNKVFLVMNSDSSLLRVA